MDETQAESARVGEMWAKSSPRYLAHTERKDSNRGGGVKIKKKEKPPASFILAYNLSLPDLFGSRATILIRDQASQLCCNKKTFTGSLSVCAKNFVHHATFIWWKLRGVFSSPCPFCWLTTVFSERPSDVACFQKLNYSGCSHKSKWGRRRKFWSVLRARCQVRRRPTGRILGSRWSEAEIGLQQSPRCWIPS